VTARATHRAEFRHSRVRRLRPALRLLAACWGVVGMMPLAAPADSLAGRQAFERGDYERAVVEWQSSADRGDAESQFGLGLLYEQGDGELKQDYKRADFWYRKAAEQDFTEAEYRLGLIWAAGGADFPRDFVEAYKWATAAAESKGIWGTAATELKGQLDKVLTTRERLTGKDRAAAWRASRPADMSQLHLNLSPASAVASGTSPVKGALPQPAPAAAPVAHGKASSGCPGWPFPTLPCTEEFPALPGAPR
jgi:hypothetical protein